MIIRHDVIADTYRPIPFTPADLRRLKETFRDHAPGVALKRVRTDSGEPYVSVTDPRLTWEEDTWIIIRGERVWQMHRGGAPLCMSLRPSGRWRSSSGPAVGEA